LAFANCQLKISFYIVKLNFITKKQMQLSFLSTKVFLTRLFLSYHNQKTNRLFLWLWMRLRTHAHARARTQPASSPFQWQCKRRNVTSNLFEKCHQRDVVNSVEAFHGLLLQCALKGSYDIFGW